MGALEQVMQLRGQGMSDEDVSSALQQQGVSPKEITDAINQANIKNAVSGEGDAPPAGGYETAGAGGAEGGYAPQTQDYSQYDAQGQATAPQEYYEEAAYAGGGGAGMSPDTMIELSTQVFSEKIKKTSKSVDELSEFKALAQVKLESMDERLKRIEKIIDTIQIKVLEKVGSFASELQKTQKELEMVENSFSKVAMPKSSSKKSSSKKK